ncbi:MAG: hypothetical protein ACT4OP_11440 [Actinomycetota bacterium]
MTIVEAPPREAQADDGGLDARPLAILMVVGILVAHAVFSLSSVDFSDRQLIDTDGHMRAVRVLDLVSRENGWFDGWVHQANAPFGHSMHWTRALDLLLIMLAAPLVPFAGWRDAIYAAAVVVGPLTHIGLGWAIAWAARPLVGRAAGYLAGLATSIQSGILSYAAAARPDHHLLILVLAVLLAGCVVRILESEAKGAAGGLVAAAGLWVSPEFLLPLGIGASAVTVNWVLTGRGRAAGRRLGRATLGGLLVVVLVERGPSDLGAVEYDRVSIVHLGLAVLLWILWEAAAGIHLRTRSGRIGLVFALVSLGVASLTVLFPGFWAGPFVTVPSELERYWLTRVAELAPLWSAAGERVTSSMFLIGSTLIGLFFGGLALRAARAERRPLAPWVFIVLWLVVTTALAWRNIRFVIYPEALAAVPTAWWAARTLSRLRVTRALPRSLLRVALMAFAVAGFAVPVGAARVLEGPAPASPLGTGCNLHGVVPDLAQVIPGPEWRRPVVLAGIDAGPELLWRLPVRIVADPYHRNVAGILDAGAAFASSDSAQIAGLLAKHRVELILVCRNDPLRPVGPDALFSRLLEGSPPNGLDLRRIPVGEPFVLYRVGLEQ